MQWLKLSAWKVADRGFEPLSGIQNVSSLLTRKDSILWGPRSARPQTARIRISCLQGDVISPSSGGSPGPLIPVYGLRPHSFHLQASEKEYYSVTELMSDLEECQAKQVHVIVDQSFSGEITRAFKRSRNHKNVVVYASCRDDQYSWGNHFTRAWTQRNHTHTCAKRIFRVRLNHAIIRSFPRQGHHWQSATGLRHFACGALLVMAFPMEDCFALESQKAVSS